MANRVKKPEMLLPLKAIQERDVDLLIVEELSCNPCFRSWFLQKTIGSQQCDHSEVWHSLSEPGMGESDIIFKVSRDKFSHLFLIENKVDADFQPNQSERYRKRGQFYIEKGMCADFHTVLTAPKLYSANVDEFDFTITYEDMMAWFEIAHDLGNRGAFKAMVLRTAIEKIRRGYFAVGDKHVTKFWLEYYKHVSFNFPNLNMKKPGLRIPKLSSFIRFYPQKIKRMKNVSLLHKFAYGNVDLQLDGMGEHLPQLKEKYGSRLLPNMKLVRAGKSACFRIQVDELNATKPFDAQLDAVDKALNEVEALYNWSTEQLLQETPAASHL